MKEVIKEMTHTYTVYQATDGTEFKSKEECLIYEDTTKCMLLTKYKHLVNKRDNEYNIFKTGNDEYMVDILKPLSDSSDIDIIIQLYRLYNKLGDDIYYSNLRDRLEKCLRTSDIIVIGRGTEYDNYEYDNYDNFVLITTLNDITENLIKNSNETN